MDVPNIKKVYLSQYEEFLPLLDHVNSLFSRGNGPSTGRRVFVDLFPHGNCNYHFSNLLVANYVAAQTGGVVVGLTVSEPLFVRFVFDQEDILALARAFGVGAVVDLSAQNLSASIQRGVPRTGELRAGIGNAELRWTGRRYFGLEDRIRRRYQLPRLGDVPTEWVSREIALADTVARAVGQLDAGAGDIFVTGHIEYDPYRLTSLLLLERGVNVIYNWVLQPFTIKLFRTPAELLSNYVQAVKDRFDETLERCRKAAPGSLQRLADYYRVSLGQIRPTQVMHRRDHDRHRRSQRSLVVMAQALSDGVHSYGDMLFADFADWIERTLQFAASRGLSIVLRDHPMQQLYDQTGFVSRIGDHHAGCPHIEILSGEAPFDPSQYAMCITTQGTPGVEMPMEGVRTVSVGRARYSEMGFVDEPQSIEEYFSLLLKAEPLDDEDASERRDRAALYGFLELFGFRTTSVFLPSGLKAPPRQMMQHVLNNTGPHSMFSDPLFHQVGACLSGEQISFNSGLFGWLKRGIS